ncbi:V-type ATP synthase subunit E family protein [Roseimarinus sediminis]|uniref:V-type ATP synthase subunit E family protein n=1 Tax=Roseimarinus sediminis TaxID=1610899 RepID=UPI003D25ED19
MDQKLKELTDKLYNEGVAKGNQQAESIVEEAKSKAAKIIAEAEEKAKAILNKAEKDAAELDKNSRSELKLAAGQMLSALEQEVAGLLTGSIVSEEVGKATSDKQFIQELIMKAVGNWAADQNLLVVVPDADHDAVEKFFAAKVKEQLGKKVTIESANGVKAGFVIEPADGSYKVSFTHDDFVSFFKEFIRPKVVELLFDRK